MKNTIIVLVGTLSLLASCAGKKTVLVVEEQRDSLAQVVRAKDSLINAVFEDINAISENLAQIRSRENLIAVAGEAEGGRRPAGEIRNDIAAIDRLLQENRSKIASLQRAAAQLRKANLRIEGLEKMIADLDKQLAQKSREIAQLRENLTRMEVEVKTLTEQVARSGAEVERLGSENVVLEDRLHAVCFIVGAEKELREAQIIDKQGFIGRTLTLNRSANFDSFTQSDARLLTEIPIGRKRVTLVTAHPEGSYRLETGADKVVTRLLIIDPDRFWESSRALVISYK